MRYPGAVLLPSGHYEDRGVLTRVEWDEASRPEPPILLADAKRHARVTHNTEDLVAADELAAAIEYAETATRRTIQLSQWDVLLDSFPARYFYLKRPPVVDIVELAYRDPDDVWQDLALDTLSIDISGDNAWVGLLTGESWPAISAEPRSVRLRYLAGYRPHDFVESVYEATPPRIPVHLAVAIKELFRFRFDRRGGPDTTIPRDIDAMLWSERVDL